MTSPTPHPPKPPPSTPSSKRRRSSSSSSSSSSSPSSTPTTPSPHANNNKELPLRTSLVRDSVRKRIFAYMDAGDKSADICLKSGLSHPRVKHYRRMWKDERRHDRRLRPKNKKTWRRKRMARSRSPTVSSDEPMQQLPLSSKLAGGRKEEVGRVGKSGCGGGGGRGKRKRGGARGLEECEANARTKEDKGSGGLETLGLQATKKGLDFPQGSENQLVIRLREPMQ